MRKGSKASQETKMKMSLARKGVKKSLETRVKMGDAQRGKKHTPERVLKNRLSHLGKKQSLETIRKRVEAWKGKNKGDKHYNWKGGITPAHQAIRNSSEYKLWRTAVFERDNYVCIWCGARNGNGARVILNADHIKPFAIYPELRFALDNGRTLCLPCHKTTENYGLNIRFYEK